MLNDLPEFKGLNPQLPRAFARIFASSLAGSIKAQNITALKVVLYGKTRAPGRHFRLTGRQANLLLFEPKALYLMHIGLIIYGSLDTMSGGYLYDRKLVAYLRKSRVTQ